MATDNFLFIPPDRVETVAFRFDVKPTSYNILNVNECLEAFLEIGSRHTFRSFSSFLYSELV